MHAKKLWSNWSGGAWFTKEFGMGSAGFPREFRMGVQNSLWFKGFHIPWRDTKFPRGGQILCDTGIYFTAKYGLPLENFDHLPKTQWKKVDPEHILLTKFGPMAYLGGLLRVLETTQVRKFNVL